MEKIDRLGWAEGVAFRAYGLTVGIRTNNPELIPEFERIIPADAKRTDDPRVDILYSFLSAKPFGNQRRGLKRMNILYNSAALVGKSLDEQEIVRALDTSLNAWLSEFSRRDLFVHAGVVEWEGRAIIIPGRSHTGKTSLVAALVKRGARYYSDEFAVITNRGRVRPFRNPLSIRSEGAARPTLIAAEDLGGVTGKASIPVGLVLMTRYRDGARWKPRQLSSGEAVLAMLDNTISARRRPKAALARLGMIAENAVALRGDRGEADETAKQIIESLRVTKSDRSSRRG